MSFLTIDPEWNIPEASFWPGDSPLNNSEVGLPILVPADWRLDLCRDGTLSLRKHGEKPFNGVAVPIYHHDDKEVLKDVQTLMCRLAHGRDPALTHEGGRRYIFSWMSLPGTLWQINAVQRVIHLYVTQSAQAASDEARRLSQIVEAAARTLAEAKRS